MMDNKLKIGLILIGVILVGIWWFFSGNQRVEDVGTASLIYTVSGCEGSEPKNEIVEVSNNKIVFNIDSMITNCDYKVQMEKEGFLIKLLLQGENCCWSIGCYNLKGEVGPLDKGTYIFELRETVGGTKTEIIKKEIILN